MEKFFKDVRIVLFLPCWRIKEFDSCSKMNFNDVIKNLSGETKRVSVVFKTCPHLKTCKKFSLLPIR